MHPEAPNQPSRADCAAQVPRAAALGSEAAPMGPAHGPHQWTRSGPCPRAALARVWARCYTGAHGMRRNWVGSISGFTLLL